MGLRSDSCLLDMVTVPRKVVGLERMSEYRGVGLEKFHYEVEREQGVLTIHEYLLTQILCKRLECIIFICHVPYML